VKTCVAVDVDVAVRGFALVAVPQFQGYFG